MLKSTARKIFPAKIFPLARSIYYSFSKIYFFGNCVFCPVCEKGFRKYLGGAGNKPSSRCPGCGTAERHRLLWLYLKKKLNILDDELTLLDIAPDQAIQKKFKSLQNINYLSIDLDSALAMQKMDLTELTFKDSSFDAIICYHVLEHIEDDRKAIRELYRVLKPGGWAILQSPVDTNRKSTLEDTTITSPEERLKMFGQEDHVRIYGNDYPMRLKVPGFFVAEDKYVLSFDDEKLAYYGLDKEEVIYFCRKN